jgi:hypothetical protein
MDVALNALAGFQHAAVVGRHAAGRRNRRSAWRNVLRLISRPSRTHTKAARELSRAAVGMNCRGSGSAHHCANNTLGCGASLHYSVFNCSTSVTSCGSYRTPWGAWGCFRIYRASNVRSSGLRSFDIRQRLLFEEPLFFGRPRGRCSIAKSSAPVFSLTRRSQHYALTLRLRYVDVFLRLRLRLPKKLHSLPSSIRRIIIPSIELEATPIGPTASRCAAKLCRAAFYDADAPPQVHSGGGDDRVSGTDANRHDGSRDGISEFGGNADSAETADLARALITRRSEGGEIRDEQGRRISALCATVRGNCAHLSGQGSAGDPTRLRAGLVAFGASCASQPANRRIGGSDRSPACNR